MLVPPEKTDSLAFLQEAWLLTPRKSTPVFKGRQGLGGGSDLMVVRLPSMHGPGFCPHHHDKDHGAGGAGGNGFPCRRHPSFLALWCSLAQQLSDLSATVRELDGFMEQVWETSLPPHPILSPVDEA